MTALATSARVLVVGAGAMGSGIAQVAARAGHTVYLFDEKPDAAHKGKATIEKDLRYLAGKGKLSEADFWSLAAPSPCEPQKPWYETLPAAPSTRH
jgi:3-hydroxybutyryl-CoA dehydrogenase